MSKVQLEEPLIEQPGLPPESVTIIIGQAFFNVGNSTLAEVELDVLTTLQNGTVFRHTDEAARKTTMLKIPDGAMVQVLPTSLFEKMQLDAKLAAARMAPATSPIAMPRGR